MFDNKSAYALNKMDPDSIVYIAADGSITRLSRQDFADEEEFRRWKEWSDAEYYAAEKAQHLYNNHTLALDFLPEKAVSLPSSDVLLELAHARLEQMRINLELVMEIKSFLTAKQFRRLWLHWVDGMTVESIAQSEGVCKSSVSESITAATKKIFAFFQKHPNKSPQNRR